jgi:phosphopantetheinyl transferase (holo-ACP synthase)
MRRRDDDAITVPFLFGVDVMAVDRVQAAMARQPTRLAATVADPAEWRRFPTTAPALACAALLTLKEATIKAIGGRPVGTGWRGTEIVGPGSELPDPIAGLVEEFIRAVRVPAGYRVGLRLDHAHDRAAALQLGPAPTGRGGDGSAWTSGLGWWGERDGEVYAVAALWTENLDRAPRR